MLRSRVRSAPSRDVEQQDNNPSEQIKGVKRRPRMKRGNPSIRIRSPSVLLLLMMMMVVLVVLILVVWISARHRKESNDLVENVMEDGCLAYGCPKYPPEVDALVDNDEGAVQKLIAEHSLEGLAMMTRKSNRKSPPFNQDSCVVISPFKTLQTRSNSDFFIGLFDGHGRQGHIVSQYAAAELPRILAEKFNTHKESQDDDWIIAALNETFIETDANAPPNAALLGGTTASVTMRRGSKLYIANAGDSRTVVVTFDGDGGADDSSVDIPYMTRFDKPHLEDERKRIEGLGGNVKIPNKRFPAGSRVWVRSDAAGEMIGLAMSRSIGDWEWGAVGVTPEPLVNIVHLDSISSEAFVLAASDGMWDMRARPQFFANYFSRAYQSKESMERACFDLIGKISPKNQTWYRDDISIILKKLMLP